MSTVCKKTLAPCSKTAGRTYAVKRRSFAAHREATRQLCAEVSLAPQKLALYITPALSSKRLALCSKTLAPCSETSVFCTNCLLYTDTAKRRACGEKHQACATKRLPCTDVAKRQPCTISPAKSRLCAANVGIGQQNVSTVQQNVSLVQRNVRNVQRNPGQRNVCLCNRTWALRS